MRQTIIASPFIILAALASSCSSDVIGDDATITGPLSTGIGGVGGSAPGLGGSGGGINQGGVSSGGGGTVASPPPSMSGGQSGGAAVPSPPGGSSGGDPPSSPPPSSEDGPPSSPVAPPPAPMTPADPGDDCSDIPPDDRESCATWAEWGECESGWIKDPGFCNRSCGRCEGGSNGGSGGQDNQGGQGDPGTSPPGNSPPPGSPPPSSPPPGGQLGDDNPYSPINGGQRGNSTRYWDCCKPSCGWSANASNPVDSCDRSGTNNIGVNDSSRSVCDGGEATTCHGMSPWAHSTQLAFGYAAANNVGCGTCWQLQFERTSGSAGNDDPGNAAVAGKTMIVMVSNTGGDLGTQHFDLLVPGGGLGLFNGCTASLGIEAGELGAQYGGFLPGCKDGGSLESRKECVRRKCQEVFGSRGLSDLEAGCMWYADWFETADNPDFVYQEVECPADLRRFN